MQRNAQPQEQETYVLCTNRLGQITRLPDDFQFPNGNAFDCWLQWNVGNAQRQIPPLQLIQVNEFIGVASGREAKDGYRKAGAARLAQSKKTTQSESELRYEIPLYMH